ncbi:MULTISPECIES: LysR family transcriptional regulator [unclassified Acinetobacter]|jgi:DNA-binding transcriptional LysR family regulator|uniref:LysR family transcriptional regulator n=1 Tax=unclassified Acinetobacter TaxID=196816 RepID=UPI0018A9C2BC|nr:MULTISPECIES: LysR family transcriptional regulator [unclassified Acinetobacter]MBJ9953055.1 LysR family transcriptional regulator [Acinetobacter baumannii]
MDKLNAMSVFVHVLEQQSFTKAAQILNLPRSTLTDAIKQLESQLNTRLLFRTTRQVSATHEGQIYYERCKYILDYIDQSDHGFLHAKPQGVLNIAVHGVFAAHYILPKLQDFLTEFPQIQLQISEGDRYVDLIKEGIDCVIRIGQLNNSELIVRHLGNIQQVTLASPQYLQRYGIPQNLKDLDSHFMVGFYSSARQKSLPLEFCVDQEIQSFDLATKIQVNGANTYTAAAINHFGIIQVPLYGHRSQIAQGKLDQILTAYPVPSLPVSLLYASKNLLSPKQKVFIEWIVQLFNDKPWHE